MLSLASAKHTITSHAHNRRWPLLRTLQERGRDPRGPTADTSPLCGSPPPCPLPSTGWHPSASSEGPWLGLLSVPVSKEIVKDGSQASCFSAYVMRAFGPNEMSPDKNRQCSQEVLIRFLNNTKPLPWNWSVITSSSLGMASIVLFLYNMQQFFPFHEPPPFSLSLFQFPPRL